MPGETQFGSDDEIRCQLAEQVPLETVHDHSQSLTTVKTGPEADSDYSFQ